KYLRKSIAINSKPGNAIGDVQTAKLKLADVYIRHNDFKDADLLLTEVQNIMTGMEGKNRYNDELRLEWYRMKWVYYDKSKALAPAYEYQQKFYNYNDSIRNVSQGLTHADMEGTFKVTEQQYNLILLKRNNQLKTFSLAAITVFSVMAVIILLMFWYNLKRYRKANNRINEQNIQMRRALSALEQSQEENTKMMKIVAHDLRNPIGGITSIASLMLNNNNHSDDDRMMLELIKTSGQHSLELVSDLLQVHIKTEELKKELLNVEQMLRYCADLLHFKAETKGQRIELALVPATILVNREKIWRVVSNLIANAIKFSPTGALISISLETFPDKVLISVKDHGIGIPNYLKDKIFDMFSEAKRQGTAGEQPFGLGLAISKQIVEAHNGRIWFESQPGMGTTFYVELPIA
ncbi:MAG TPA: HAMP domain-containing sensor histidine kinase, partial [Mucilaginibacter sp.]